MIAPDTHENQITLIDPQGEFPDAGAWDYTAKGHGEDCWESGCHDCEVHALDCPCELCRVNREEFDRKMELLAGVHAYPANTWLWTELYRACGLDVPDPPPTAILEHSKPLTVPEVHQPAILERNDGRTLLYAGKLNSVFGEPGVGKSWVALVGAVSALRKGGRVLWLDFEDTASTLAVRAKALGVLGEVESPNFRFLAPSFAEDDGNFHVAATWLADRPYSLVVLDSLEAAGCPSDGGDVMPWFQKFSHPFRDRGVGRLFLDHVPKQRLDRPRGGIGSQRKLAEVDGAALAVGGRPWTKNSGGSLKLVIHKDRGGDLPGSIGKTIALIHGEYTSGNLGYWIVAPDVEAEGVDVTLDVLSHIASLPDGVKGLRTLRKAIKGRAVDVDNAISDLRSNGFIVVSKNGKANVYGITQAGLDTLAEEGVNVVENGYD